MKSSVLPCAFRGTIVALSLSLATAGCGGDSGSKGKGASQPRVKVSGTVKLDGNPVPGGSVTYINIATGNSATGPITNGEFSIPAKDGPNPGENAVLIRGKDDAKGPDVWMFNTKTPSKIAGENHKEDFAVDKKETKPAPPPENET